MASGQVRFLSEEEAYGFIQRDGYGADVFVHRGDVTTGTLREGVRVEFTLDSAGRGPRARDVKVSSDPVD